MSVVDGQIANAATFNSAFGSKQADNTFQGKQTLARPGSGSTILDAQQAINDVIASDALKIPLSEKGAPLGVAELDASGKVTASQLPNTDSIAEGAVNLYFTDSRAFLANNTSGTDNTSGSNAALPSPAYSIIELINPALISIETIVAPPSALKFILINNTGADIVVKNESGATAANRIKTGKGADLTFKNESMFVMAYHGNSQRWYIAGGAGGEDVQIIKEVPSGLVNGVNDTFTFSDLAIDGSSVWVFVDGVYRLSGINFTLGVTQSSIQFTSDIPVTGQVVEVHYFKKLGSVVAPVQDPALQPSGSIATPNIITAGGGVSTTADQRQYQFVVSSGGAVTVTVNPQIQAGSIIGQELILEGTSDTDYPILNDGSGVALNGALQLKNEKKAYLVWNGLKWSEISRT